MHTAASRAATTTIEIIAPKGPTSWPFAFEWKGNAGEAAVYRVTVVDMAERPLVEQDTRGTRLDAPRDLEVLLPQTRRFQWRVTLLDADGEPSVQTPLVEFTVK